jgi:P27 family predicted phage terminase small subunit
MRVLTEADYITLANLCQQYSMLMKAQEQLTKSGLLFKTQSGYIQQSPLVSIVSNCTAQVTALCREFGLTPSARTRVQAHAEEEKPAQSPWEALKRRTSNGL